MFYYPLVLRRNTGCFSTIWLAATGGIRVPPREFLKVNVQRTCDDIINYILEQVPPPQPNVPRPRFSLYLSSQLQYGVVVVFHRQCVIFLKEVQSIVGQLVKHSRSKKLDMEDTTGRQMMLYPDALSHLEVDPLFGVMEEFLPSPSALMQVEETPERRASSAEPEATPARSPSPMSRHTVPRDRITIREPEAAGAPMPEFLGQELQENLEDTLEALLAHVGDILTEAEAAKVAEPETERAGEPPTALAREATVTTIEVDTATASSRELTLRPQDGPLGGPQDGPLGGPQALADQMTPTGAPPPSSSSATASAQLPDTQFAGLPEETQPKRKRGRQLIFLDPQTQIPHEELERQIKDDLAETRARPLLPPQPYRLRTAEDLLSNPCGFLPEELQLLWEQGASITPVTSSELWPGDEGVDSTGSEEEGAEMGPARRAEEVPGDGPEVSAGSGSLPLEASPQDVSPLYPAEPERLQPGAALPDIPEMPEDTPAKAAEPVGPLPGELEEQALLFHDLLPPEPDRRRVSSIFQKFLGILATGKLRAAQARPYGDIVIRRGRNYDEEPLPW